MGIEMYRAGTGLVMATLLLTAGLPPVVAAEQPKGLLEVVEEALRTNPQVLADGHSRRAADHVVEQAQAGYKPRIDLSVGHGRERTQSASTAGLNRELYRHESSLTASQTLFDGFETSSRVEAGTARAQAAAYTVASTSEQTALRAIEVYLNFLRRRTLTDHAQENLDLHNTIYDQIELRSRAGVTTKVNLEQIEGRRALSQSDVVFAESQVHDAGYNFQRVVGFLPYELAPAPAMDCKALPGTVEEALQMANAVHPALAAARANLQAAYADEKVALSAMYPDVTLDAELNKNNDIDGVDAVNEDTLIMLRMAYSAYNGGRDLARIRELRHFTDRALETHNQLQRRIEESTRLSWNALDALERRAPELQRRMETTVATRDAYSKQFNIGQRTLLDLLDVGRETFAARSEFADVEYDRMLAAYRLLTSMGILLETIGVEPPAEARLASTEHPNDPHMFSAFFPCGKTF